MNVSNIGLKSFEEKLIIYRNFVKILSLGELAIVKTKIVRKKRPACTRLYRCGAHRAGGSDPILVDREDLRHRADHKNCP